MKIALTLALFLCTFAAHAAHDFTLSPSSGPTAGGTLVTVKGNFGQWPYGLIFGRVGVPATRVDEHTLTAVTPAHLPGTVDVVVFEYDIGISTDLKFTFTGDAPEEYERILLPIFTPPVRGAFDSEFHTDFRAFNNSHLYVQIFGLASRDTNESLELSTWAPEIATPNFPQDGNPGRFVYVPKEQAERFAANLRVHDVTRDAQNFGTEMPVVRAADFFTHERIALLGIPTDPRFRNTLRIYATREVAVDVRIGQSTFHRVTLTPGRDLFEPAYVVIGDFPANEGEVRVLIDPRSENAPPIWAFVSVTNNDTQMITTITPRK